MRCAENQHAVEDLATQSAEEAFAGRVHPGSRDPAKSFMRSEAAVASAAGRGHGGGDAGIAGQPQDGDGEVTC
jgi:hypothetical protein